MARDISGHIRELLFRHDCVIVPGFGAFIGNYFPARTDRKEGLFEPPSRKITFNRHLTGNDGLLIGHISSVLEVGYASAREIVNEWSEDLRRKIMADKPVTIDLLGTFTLNYERAIIFEPDLTVNYLLSSYGLTTYYRQPVSGFDVRKKALEKRHDHAVSQPTMRSLLARAAVIGPILIALALVPFNDRIFRSNVEESNLNPLARAELEFNREQIEAEKASRAAEYIMTDNTEPEAGNIPEVSMSETPAVTSELPSASAPDITPVTAPAVTRDITRETTPAVTRDITRETTPAVTRDITRETTPAVTREVIPEAATQTTPIQAPVRRTPAVVVEEYRYMIIIGSFQGEENALTMVEQLRRQGFDPEVAGGPDGYLRVSAQSFPTLDNAKEVLGKVRREYPGAWVYKSRQ